MPLCPNPHVRIAMDRLVVTAFFGPEETAQQNLILAFLLPRHQLLGFPARLLILHTQGSGLHCYSRYAYADFANVVSSRCLL